MVGPRAEALIAGRDILCISSIDWDFIWQGHQEIMSALASRGNRVLFIENTGARGLRVRMHSGDAHRLFQRVRNRMRAAGGFRQQHENLFIYAPVILPFPYAGPARWLNRRWLIGSLRRWMREKNFRRPVVWAFLPTPLTLDMIRELNPVLTIYYCIDDFAASSSLAREIRDSERELMRRADMVFVTSARLQERALQENTRVHCFPFGVSYQRFEAARLSSDAVPADLLALKRPVIGYVGGLHQWLDQELLAAVAERLPDASFALIGPPQVDVTRLASRPNIHLLGSRSHAELPGYIKGFDVGLIPYRRTEYTANVYPTKLNEYLAMGVPTVATDLPEIQRFNAAHGSIVGIGAGADAFAAAILRALQPSSAETLQRRIDVARANSWERRIDEMTSLMAEALG